MADLSSLTASLRPAAQAAVQQALLVQLDIDTVGSKSDARTRLWHEFLELARAAGASATGEERIRIRAPAAATLIGSGRLASLAEQVQQLGIELVIFNNDLKPNQERNLEQTLCCRVLDRTGLILDIFSQRANSHAGRLQVEMAQLKHLSTRLLRGWSHLERQRGGIGLRGPGESQLELDRRMIERRMQKIHQSLDKLRKQRRLGQKRRHKERACLVSLVGYTNAGKSTLFNVLTHEQVPAADRLFETLDTFMRRCYIGGPSQQLQHVVLSDTVGFIGDLPPHIIEAFRATLEGVMDADLLLLVEDHSSDRWQEQREEVDQVLRTIGAEDVPRLRILNKVDVTGMRPGVRREDGGLPSVLAVSSLHGQGIALVRSSIAKLLSTKIEQPLPAGEDAAVESAAVTEGCKDTGTDDLVPPSAKQSGA